MEKQSEKSSGKALRRSAEFIGLPLFSIEEGREIGKVKEIIVDQPASKVTAFLVEDPSWPNSKILPFNSVRSFGKDALVIDSQNQLNEAQDLKKFGQLSGKEHKKRHQSKPQNKPKVLMSKTNQVVIIDVCIALILLIIASIISYYRIQIQYWPGRGPAFDSYALLSNALTMAGKSNYFELGRPPMHPLLISMFFRMGFVSETVAYLIDAVFFGLGGIGLYLLMRLRFTWLPSLLGVLIYMSVPDMVMNLGFGQTDIMALSLSIWVIYFSVLGAEKNPKYLLPVFPLFIIAFLTRFTAAVIIFPILFYLLLRANILRHLKIFLQSLSILFGVLLVDIISYWQLTKGQALIQFASAFEAATLTERIVLGKELENVAQSQFFYVTNFLKFLSFSKISWIFAIFFLFGILFLLKNLIKGQKYSIVISYISITSILLFIVYFIFFSKVNFVLINILFLALFLLVVPALFKFEDDKKVLDILIFLWFISFLTYQSHQQVKESRYFITMIPAISYFVSLGLIAITKPLKKISNKKVMFYSISAFISTIMIFLIASSAYRSYGQVTQMGKWGFPENVKQASDWLRPKLKKDSVVYSDYFVAVAWFLKKPTMAMPTFNDIWAYNQELEKYQADYFVSIWIGRGLDSYKLVKKFGAINIFKRINYGLPPKPKIFLVGQDIDHYLEKMLDFKFLVMRRKSPFADDAARAVGTTYLDDYSLEELQSYPILLFYNFKWRNFLEAEKLAREFVERGGTIIIDTSGNSRSFIYDLNNRSFLGLLVTRRKLDKFPNIAITSELAGPEQVDFNKFAPFVDEFGEPWMGSDYKGVAEPKGDFKSLATANGKTLVGLQKIGRGRVIWIGYNVIFHGFFHENKEEKKFVQNIFNFVATSK